MKQWRTGLVLAAGLLPAAGAPAAQPPTQPPAPAPAPTPAPATAPAPAKGGPVPLTRPPRQAAKSADPAAAALHLRLRAARQLLEANLPVDVLVPLCLPYLQPQGPNTHDVRALRVLAIDTLARGATRATPALPQLFALAADPTPSPPPFDRPPCAPWPPCDPPSPCSCQRSSVR